MILGSVACDALTECKSLVPYGSLQDPVSSVCFQMQYLQFSLILPLEKHKTLHSKCVLKPLFKLHGQQFDFGTSLNGFTCLPSSFTIHFHLSVVLFTCLCLRTSKDLSVGDLISGIFT